MSNIKREIELVLHLIDKLDPNVKNGGEKQNVSMTVEDGCKAACLLSTVLESVESIYCTPAPKVEDDDDGVDQLINEDQIVDEDEIEDVDVNEDVDEQDPELPFPVPPVHPESKHEPYEIDKDTFLSEVYSVLTSEEDACTALSIAIGIVKATESKVCPNHK